MKIQCRPPRLSSVVQAYSSSAGEVETGESLGIADYPPDLISEILANERSWLKKKKSQDEHS